MSKLGILILGIILFFILRGMLQGSAARRRPERPGDPPDPGQPGPDDVIDVEVIEK